MDSDLLECFVAVAQELHLGRAAIRMSMTTSNLSKRCTKLEQQLGVLLLDRSSRQVQLTPEGVVLVEEARRVVAEMNRFRMLARDASQGRVGELVISYSPGSGELIGRVVRALRAQSPKVEYRLQQHDSVEVLQAVMAGRAAVGACWKVLPRGLASLTIMRTRLDHLVMPADHRLAAMHEICVADFQGETLLASQTSDRLEDHSPPWHSPANVAVRHEYWIAESQVMDSIVAGLGLAVFDEDFVARNPRPGIVARKLSSELIPEPVGAHLVWRADNSSALVREFVKVARSLFLPSEHPTEDLSSSVDPRSQIQ
jgi:DNA-binding transcriptional LysR family regulator